MDKYQIRTSETDTVKGVASMQHLDVSLKQTTKNIPFPYISDKLSQREVYDNERRKGNKFRFILTIAPYCSNVLFNPLTEIIKDEGSDDVKVVTDVTNMTNIDNPEIKRRDNIIINDAIGTDKPTRTHMIYNNEYSSPLHGGFDYKPGYDFFDNHVLRNISFKIVNPLSDKDSDIKDRRLKFNTLEDFVRDRNGNVKKYSKRLSINDSGSNIGFNNYKHLYLRSDILSIDESINNNLTEDNGWWGFVNNTTINPQELKNRRWNNIGIGKAINNKKSCEFIDMYPDRSLFSFAPKYNKYTNKNEHNWDVLLTYPYRNIYDHPICLGGSSYIQQHLDHDGDTVYTSVNEGGRWMGLKVVNAALGVNGLGHNSVMFRTYTKHGLKQGDYFYLYYTVPYKDNKDFTKCGRFSDDTLNGKEIYYETRKYYKVSNVGDFNKNNSDFLFYVTDNNILEDLYNTYLNHCDDLISKGRKEDVPFLAMYESDDRRSIRREDGNLKIGLLSQILKYSNFKIRRCVNGVKSTYYIRQFRKVPNLRGASRAMTYDESRQKAKFNGKFENFITDNALGGSPDGKQQDFNNELYQLAFSSTIYNDNIAQITFTDGIDVTGLLDNLGRPLSEIYYTFVKNNSGYEVWYNKEEPIYSNKEIKEKYSDKKDEFKRKYGVDYDGYVIEYSHCFGKVTSGFYMYTSKDDTDEVIGPKSYWKKVSSITHISNIVNDEKTKIVDKDYDSRSIDEVINRRNNFFCGDLVEYNPLECTETVISEVLHRFNTAQRETVENPFYSQAQYHEIVQDDYDPKAFDVNEFSCVSGKKDEDDTNKSPMVTNFESRIRTPEYKTISRPEGYYYKAHYKMQIKEFSRLKQGSNRTLRIRSAKPVQRVGILIEVNTLLYHKLSDGDTILICDDKNDIRYVTKCVKVIDSLTFLMSPDYSEYIINASDFEDSETLTNMNNLTYSSDFENKKERYKSKLNWFELCEVLNGNKNETDEIPSMVLRVLNPEIPEYATYMGDNQYTWRDLIGIGDERSTILKEQVFANGYFYFVDKINFYLKRQDPFGYNDLYFDGSKNYPYFPNDPHGVKQRENNFVSKEETLQTC